MYTNHFGLSMRPFDMSPDPRLVHGNAPFCSAFNTLRRRIENGSQLMELSGNPGMGKTTLLLKLIAELEGARPLVFLPIANLCFDDLLSYACDQLQIDCAEAHDRHGGIDTRAFADLCAAAAADALIIVDEAQNLPDDSREGLMALLPVLAERAPGLQIILAGSPPAGHNPDSIFSPISAQPPILLDGLTAAETVDFIRHRLKRAGATTDPIFEDDALTRVSSLSKGTPRLINTLCDSAMLTAYSEDKHLVDAPTVERAIQDTGLGLQQDATLADDDHQTDATTDTGLVASQCRSAWLTATRAAMALGRWLTQTVGTGVTQLRFAIAKPPSRPREPRAAHSRTAARQSFDSLRHRLHGWLVNQQPGHHATTIVWVWALSATAVLAWTQTTPSNVADEDGARNQAPMAQLLAEESPDRLANADLRAQLARLRKELRDSESARTVLQQHFLAQQNMPRLPVSTEQVESAGTGAPADNPATGAATIDKPDVAKPDRDTPTERRHRVAKGDTLWGIARQYSVSVEQLASWNQLNQNQSLRPGTTLVVMPKPGSGTFYTVRQGDSLYGISRKFSVSVTNLQQWNQLDKSSHIKTNQLLLVNR